MSSTNLKLESRPGAIVIVGVGHAGFHLASALRQGGYDGSIRLLHDDPNLPYQRPPPKAHLKAEGRAEALLSRHSAFYQDHHIGLIADGAAVIDSSKRIVALLSGTLADDPLAVATIPAISQGINHHA